MSLVLRGILIFIAAALFAWALAAGPPGPVLAGTIAGGLIALATDTGERP